ncbi:hypothetical protein SNOG_12389 [Parastagonospora nodorum SN15]|uniref:Uncharacterized protein n=1 Tax=Phaeosphaeria nodorum (strain SN15 / ATCC MYA-4574 / FGSC 10173) TaxID=321614 RepID=Q0U775_PHANO|nr:hypothetical protein SNOG_12389 [Parastagonospora nodorum SN15]EAT80202.1 hypothetical protein SNOG_12389 [Parastagonospora nodorum SN15]
MAHPFHSDRPRKYSGSLSKAHAGHIRNPDGWLTGRPRPTLFTGSYRGIISELRLAISPTNASQHHGGH